MGVVVKSVIVLGSVYLAMFGSGMSESKLTRTLSEVACSVATPSQLPVIPAASVTTCAGLISAQVSAVLPAKSASEPIRIGAHAAQSLQTLTRMDFIEPWSGPIAPKGRTQRRRG